MRLEMSRLLVYLGVLLLFAGPCGIQCKDAEVTPSDPFVFIGNNLTLTCKVTKADITGNVSGSMHFVAKIKEYPGEEIIPAKYTHVTGPKSIELVYPVTSPSDGRMYTCKLNTTSIVYNNSIVSSQMATVEYPILAVDNITCVVSNWESMNCSWKFQEKVVCKDRIEYSLKWTQWLHETPQNDCQVTGLSSCVWLEENFKMNIYNMIVNVTVKDKQGNVMAYKNTSITKNPKYIVKPNPVEDLTVVNRTSKCLTLAWRFKPKYRNSMEYALNVGQKNARTTKTLKEVCGLHPARTYTIAVSGIPIPSNANSPKGFMSDPTVIQNSTLEDKPSGAPRVVPGSFFQFGEYRSKDCSENSTSCSVTLFWQGLTEEERNGEITAYRVELEDMTSAGSNEPQTVSGGKRSVSLTMKRSHEYKATFLAGTDVGFSDNSSSLLIPSYANKPSFPSVFVVEAQNSRRYITWTPSTGHEHDQYTLYTCSGSWSELSCESEMSWTHVENVTSYEMNVHSVSNPLVGISHEVKTSANNIISSGIKWSTCTYKKDQTPDKPKITKVDTQSEDSLLVEWQRFGCDVYVDEYILSICTTNNQACTDQVEQITIDDPTMSKRSYLLGNLVPHKLYNITLRAFSRGRAGPLSTPVVAQVVNNALSTGSIAGIVFGGLFVLVLLVSLILICGRACYQALKYMKYEIEIPKVSDYEPNVNAGEDQTEKVVINNTKYMQGTLETLDNSCPGDKDASGFEFSPDNGPQRDTTLTATALPESNQRPANPGHHAAIPVFTPSPNPEGLATHLSSLGKRDKSASVILNSDYITDPDHVHKPPCYALLAPINKPVSAETGDSIPVMTGDGCVANTSPESPNVATCNTTVLYSDYVTDPQNPSFAITSPSTLDYNAIVMNCSLLNCNLSPYHPSADFDKVNKTDSSDCVTNSDLASQDIPKTDASDGKTLLVTSKTSTDTVNDSLLSATSGCEFLLAASAYDCSIYQSSGHASLPGAQVYGPANVEQTDYVSLPDVLVDDPSNVEQKNYVPLPAVLVGAPLNVDISSDVRLPDVSTEGCSQPLDNVSSRVLPAAKSSGTMGCEMKIASEPFARDVVCLGSQELPIHDKPRDMRPSATALCPANTDSTITGKKKSDAGDGSSPESPLASSGHLLDEIRTSFDTSEDIKPLNEDAVSVLEFVSHNAVSFRLLPQQTPMPSVELTSTRDHHPESVQKESDHPDLCPKGILGTSASSIKKPNRSNSHLPVLALPLLPPPPPRTSLLTPLHSTTSDSSSFSTNNHARRLTLRSICSDSGTEIDFNRFKQKNSELQNLQDQFL